MAKKVSSVSVSVSDSSSSTSTAENAWRDQLVIDLMAIAGRSGEEAAVAEFIRAKLIAAGADPKSIVTDNANKKTTLPGNVGNLIFKLPGTFKGPRRMLSAHMDTVPICVGSKPKQDGDFVRSADPSTGLGGDDRAGCATILATALEILQKKLPHPPLTFCWFIQEEVGLHGARHLQHALLGKPAMCFNWDGGGPERLTIGATGGYRMNVEVFGRASHAGVAPEQGVSAIAAAALAVADLHQNGWHGLVVKGKNRGTTNVGYIHGGDATNVVTDQVSLRVEARSHDPKFRQKIVAEIERAFTRAAKAVKNDGGESARVTFDGRLDYESFLLDPKSPCVIAAQSAVSAEGREPQHVISNGGVDANQLNAHGIPTVTLGCGQMNIHMTSETLDLKQYRAACAIALRLAAG